jgi:hypothetical protein
MSASRRGSLVRQTVSNPDEGGGGEQIRVESQADHASRPGRGGPVGSHGS